MHIKLDMVLHSAGSVNLCEYIRNYLKRCIFIVFKFFRSKKATNTLPLASREALGPIEEPRHRLRVVEQFCILLTMQAAAQ